MPQSCTAVILSPCGEEIHRDDWQNECFRTSHVYLYSGLRHSIFLSCFCLFFYLSPLLSVLFYLVTLPLYTILSDLSKWAGNLFPFVWGFVSPCLSLTEAGVLSEVLQEPLALFFLVPTATTRAPGRDGKVSGSGVHVVGGHVSSCVQRNTQTERGTVNKQTRTCFDTSQTVYHMVNLSNLSSTNASACICCTILIQVPCNPIVWLHVVMIGMCVETLHLSTHQWGRHMRQGRPGSLH